MGWGCIDVDTPGVEDEENPRYVDSGIFGISRADDESWQDYKLKLTEFHTERAVYLVTIYEPDALVSEIIPAIGGHNFKAATQEQLAQAAISGVHAVAFICGVPVYQIAANTVKKRIGGAGGATKVKVRNGVMTLLPVLQPRKKEWVKIFDEPDGIAVGLAWSGYEVSPLP
jgi:Holliday junction resolvasome RuvABC endonuclease subunit